MEGTFQPISQDNRGSSTCIFWGDVGRKEFIGLTLSYHYSSSKEVGTGTQTAAEAYAKAMGGVAYWLAPQLTYKCILCTLLTVYYLEEA